MAGKQKKRRINTLFYAGLTTLMLALFPGCVSIIPEREYYRKILNMPYVENKFDCTDKTQLYKNLLSEKGYDARHVIGSYPKKGKSVNHSWIEYTDNNGIIRLIDPTINEIISGFPRQDYKNYSGVCFVYFEKDEDTVTIGYSMYK